MYWKGRGPRGYAGVTGTPVIDPATNTLYVVANTKPTSDSIDGIDGANFYYLYSIDISTGKDKYPRIEIKVRNSSIEVTLWSNHRVFILEKIQGSDLSFLGFYIQALHRCSHSTLSSCSLQHRSPQSVLEHKFLYF